MARRCYGGFEQWHPLENTAGDDVRNGDNGQLEERCSDGDETRSDLARCNEEKICTDVQERYSGDDQENCSNDNVKERKKKTQ